MNNLRKVRCPRCKNFYTYETGLPPACCPKCALEKENQTRQVRDLLWENRGLNAMQLHEKTGLPIERITGYINNGDMEEWEVATKMQLKNGNVTGFHSFKKGR